MKHQNKISMWLRFVNRGSQLFFAFILCSFSISHAQVIFEEQFDDGELLNNPTWQGNLDRFAIVSNELQLVDVVAGQSQLTTSFAATSLNEMQWNIMVKQTFAGSDNNQSRIYLASSGSTITYTGTSGSAGITGYYLRLGEGGSNDAIRLFRDNGSSVTELGAGTPGLIAASFTARIKVTRSAAGVWTVSAAMGGGNNYQLQFTATDNTYTTTTNFGMVCTYTASNADNFFFDDIYFGEIIYDTTPPSLVSATATSATTLDVLFNEPVDVVSAQDAANYQVAGNSVVQAVQDGVNQALVRLTFESSFPSNVSQTLSVSAIEDLSGNIMPSGQVNFLWLVPASASYRSVVFNEILADPTPTVGLPEVEFIELFNATTETFDLGGWTLVNTTTPKVLPTYALGPGQYVILCNSTNTSFFTNVIGIPSFTALTNSTDSLTLLDNTGQIIDLLVYKDSWFATSAKKDGGWTLEQKNPYFDCANSQANWAESINPIGGTPEAINSVFNNAPDITPPTVTSVQALTPSLIFIQFSELMDTTGTAGLSFNLIPFNTASQPVWNANLTGFTLQTQSPMLLEQYYELTISGMSDCSGNELLPFTTTLVKGIEPMPGDLIINEIYPDPDPATGSPAAEFIEVFNRTDRLLELTNIKVNNGVFTQQVVLPPNDYLVIGDSDFAGAFLLMQKKALMPAFPGLTNSGLKLTLRNGAGVVLDEVSYKISWYGDGAKDDGGYSLELINPNAPCSSSNNWRASNSPTGSTPGYINSIYDITPDTQGPELLYVFSEPTESITLLFNEPIASESLEDIVWTVNGTILEDTEIYLSDTANNEVVMQYGEMEDGVVYEFTATGFTDCWGNPSGIISGRFAIGEAPQQGDLIINELLHNPYTGGSDFMELYNRSMRNISVAGWKTADYTSGSMNTPKVITNRNLILFPGEYLAITEKGQELKGFYPGTVQSRVFQIEDLPDFSATDIAVLLTPDNGVSDLLDYNPDFHYALLDDTKGVSLERISPTRPSSDKTNWHSAAESVGFATPGYRNSQSNPEKLTDNQLEVSPEIFSPDNDGYNDVVTFSYKMDREGYLGNMIIYDSEGRRIRQIMQSELLGITGSKSWDGFNDERIKAGIGIYIVFFEAFHLDGSVSKIKKTCVLGHQLD